MHGLGNDFIVIDCRKKDPDNLPELARRLCKRRFGIGADQLLLLYKSRRADVKMRIFNADGTEVEMCGNGIRCLAKYVWDRGQCDADVLSVETPAGLMRPQKSGDMVRVDMGEPIFEGRLIPVNIDGKIQDFPIKAAEAEFLMTCVSMGNPHAVIVVDDVDSIDVKKYGSLIEDHKLFPNRINVEFIEIVNYDLIRMRVWERGSGETMACGTGASAVAVVASQKGLSGKNVTVSLTGGDLFIEWHENNHVYMTGPAVEVFNGTVSIE